MYIRIRYLRRRSYNRRRIKILKRSSIGSLFLLLALCVFSKLHWMMHFVVRHDRLAIGAESESKILNADEVRSILNK